MSEEDILIALKEIHARYCIPAHEQNYTDKDYACMQYEKLVLHLRTKLQLKDNIIKEVREYIKENEKEYGSLMHNEKIILKILDKEEEYETTK